MTSVLTSTYANSQLNLGAPELEYIDPTPDVHALFLHFDLIFFKSSLKSRATVRWSKRMYSCAGVCRTAIMGNPTSCSKSLIVDSVLKMLASLHPKQTSILVKHKVDHYEGRAGYCDIAISEPLLKLRPRKDLIETLIHEMIHAYLFITDRDRDRDGHGPNFHFHMNRINKMAGLNISVYHDFHDEVKLYQTHVWRCDGICRNTKPYYGIVRRSNNRAPGPSDRWWNYHKRSCGGTFIKIKQPEPKEKTMKGKIKDDKPKIKRISSIDVKTVQTLDNYMTKTVNKPTMIKDKETNKVSRNSIDNQDEKAVISKNKENTDTSSVQAKVRNHWANYPYTSTPNSKSNNKTSLINNNNTINNNNSTNDNKKPNKHKIDTIDTTQSKRVKKIDDYFKATASSILQDIYGPLKLVEKGNEKLKAILEPENYVICPICNQKVNSLNINAHVDECLNKDLIQVLQNDNAGNLENDSKPTNKDNVSKNIEFNDIKPDLTKMKIKQEIKTEFDYTSPTITPKIEVKTEPNSSFGIKAEPSTSYNINSEVNIAFIQECACCGEMVQKPMQDHLEECLAFFTNNTTEPEEGLNQSTSSVIMVDDDDDEFNESQTFNPTGTKYPCPSCLKMIENDEMNNHLDGCLN